MSCGEFVEIIINVEDYADRDDEYDGIHIGTQKFSHQISVHALYIVQWIEIRQIFYCFCLCHATPYYIYIPAEISVVVYLLRINLLYSSAEVVDDTSFPLHEIAVDDVLSSIGHQSQIECQVVYTGYLHGQ